MTNLQGVVVTLLLSQTAWLVLYCVENFPILESPSLLFLPLGTVLLIGLFIFLKFVLPSNAYSVTDKKIERRGLLYYTCCLFSWSCIVDGIFFLEHVQLVSGFTGFYLKIGEPYLGTSFGSICNAWDATVHYFLYLTIIYCIDNGKDYRDILLFYLGSMLCSMILLLMGGLGGIHGDFYPATVLNTPYVILPIYELLTVMNKQRPSPANLESKEKLNSKFLLSFLTIALSILIVYGIIRGWAAMKSPFPAAAYYVKNVEPYLVEPAKFGYIWALIMMFVGFPYQISTLYALYHSGCSWLLDWSMFFAGFEVYGSVLMMAQFLPGVAPEFHPPSSMANAVVLGNFMVALVAVLTAYIVHTERNFFMRPVAVATKKRE